MIACPNCKRRIITRRDILYAPLDGTAQCRACGQHSRLDTFSRWVVSCLVAVSLPALLLTWGVFYSGHLLVVSMIVIIVAARVMAWLALPFFGLEPVPSHIPLDRRQSVIILSALVAAAFVLDAFIASRFESEDTIRDAEAPAAIRNLQR
ncbi:MAG TPA: hypothetical protein VHP37_21765 [Burkholderiales bacterium]|nr:hypothetical protein [Burkholderiales bacterium]